MLSSMQLFSFLSIALVVLAVHSTNGVPVNSDASDEMSAPIDEQNKFLDAESRLFKRKLPVEGILIGRRSFPYEGILIGKRDYPTEGILLGKRNFPTEGILLGKRRLPTGGILLGKRDYPTEGILLGKRNSRFFAPNPMGYNRFGN